MNAIEKISRFADFLNTADLARCPTYLILYRSDGTVLHSIEIDLNPEFLALLREKEQRKFARITTEELIQRTHASAALFVSQIENRLIVTYESATEHATLVYPITYDAESLRLGPPAPAPGVPAIFTEFFLP